VVFSGTTHGWAVGASGTILATSDGGAHWKPEAAPAPEGRDLNSVTFTDPSHGWAVRHEGNILLVTTDGGAHWSKQASATGTFLNSVVFADTEHGCAVGDYGSIVMTTDGGMHWVAQRRGSANAPYLYAVASPDATHIWAVGGLGTILVYNSTGPAAAKRTGAPGRSDTALWLMAAALILLTIGSLGVVLRTRRRTTRDDSDA
jgi:photosystem II stability/assembly factor-like uncharacterized protein